MITVQLDAKALEKLLEESSEEARVALKQAVLEEASKRVIKRILPSEFQALARSLIKEELESKMIKLEKSSRGIIEIKPSERAKKALLDYADLAATEAINAMLANKREELDKKIQSKIDSEIDRIVHDRLESALEKVKVIVNDDADRTNG